jgi:hypothetical protein
MFLILPLPIIEVKIRNYLILYVVLNSEEIFSAFYTERGSIFGLCCFFLRDGCRLFLKILCANYTN